MYITSEVPARSAQEPQETLLALSPFIGPEYAGLLYAYFKTASRLALTFPENVRPIAGFGPKRLKIIQDYLDARNFTKKRLNFPDSTQKLHPNFVDELGRYIGKSHAFTLYMWGFKDWGSLATSHPASILTLPGFKYKQLDKIYKALKEEGYEPEPLSQHSKQFFEMKLFLEMRKRGLRIV